MIGIDAIAFVTSRYCISLKTLAQNRNVDYNKYYMGIGQEKMSVFFAKEDIVTMAVAAAEKVLEKIDDKNSIDLLLFATESSFDLSKSAGIYVHKFLELKKSCRVVELKQACYSATAALQLAKSYIVDNPSSRALVIGSDIVKYTPGTSGEPTQGGAAVAFVVSSDPRILTLEKHSSVYTTDVMDFWRPISAKEALFDGKLSASSYLKALSHTFEDYLLKSNLTKDDIDYSCFHSPFGKMAKKASAQIFPNRDISNTLTYNAIIGNSCTASLYICLTSLLEQCTDDMTGKRIGCFSYGSGSVAEYFSFIVQQNYQSLSMKNFHEQFLASRTEISFADYEQLSSINIAHKYTQTSGMIDLECVRDNMHIYMRK